MRPLADVWKNPQIYAWTVSNAEFVAMTRFKHLLVRFFSLIHVLALADSEYCIEKCMTHVAEFGTSIGFYNALVCQVGQLFGC